MNGPAFALLTSAAVLRGELRRIVLSLGIVLLILFVGWVIEEWRVCKSEVALGWLGLCCLGLLGLAALALLCLGLI